MSTPANELIHRPPVITTVERDADGSVRLVPRELESESSLYYQGLSFKHCRPLTGSERVRLRRKRMQVFLSLVLGSNLAFAVVIALASDVHMAAIAACLFVGFVPQAIRSFRFVKAIELGIEGGEVLVFAEENRPDVGPDKSREITRHGHVLLSVDGAEKGHCWYMPVARPVWLAKRGLEPGPLTVAERTEIMGRLNLMAKRRDYAKNLNTVVGITMALIITDRFKTPFGMVFLPLMSLASWTSLAITKEPTKKALARGLEEAQCTRDGNFSKRFILLGDTRWTDHARPAEWRSQDFVD